jgi:hypothetical protein
MNTTLAQRYAQCTFCRHKATADHITRAPAREVGACACQGTCNSRRTRLHSVQHELAMKTRAERCVDCERSLLHSEINKLLAGVRPTETAPVGRTQPPSHPRTSTHGVVVVVDGEADFCQRCSNACMVLPPSFVSCSGFCKGWTMCCVQFLGFCTSSPHALAPPQRLNLSLSHINMLLDRQAGDIFRCAHHGQSPHLPVPHPRNFLSFVFVFVSVA